MSYSARRRLAKSIAARNEPFQTFGYLFTTVSAVTPSGSRDGTYAVKVQINSDQVPCTYLAGYINGHTPTVGDQVGVLFIDGAPVILDRQRGFPNF